MWKIFTSVWPLGLMTVAIIAIVYKYKIGGENFAADAAKETWKMFLSIAPSLILVFILIGMSNVILNQNKELIRNWMSGNKGLLGSFVAGFGSPGNLAPMPAVRTMWEDGFNKKALLTFLVTASLINWRNLLWFGPVLGWRLALIQWGISVVLSMVFLLFMILA